MASDEPTVAEDGQIDPVDFLRRALQISPEDAAEVRDTAGMTAEHRAAYERWKQADARVAEFASTEPLTDGPQPTWTDERRAAYAEAVAELQAAKASLKKPNT